MHSKSASMENTFLKCLQQKSLQHIQQMNCEISLCSTEETWQDMKTNTQMLHLMLSFSFYHKNCPNKGSHFYHLSLYLSAMRPTRSIQFSCTFSCLFFRIGVRRGRRSLIGGVILCIPIEVREVCLVSQCLIFLWNRDVINAQTYL